MSQASSKHPKKIRSTLLCGSPARSGQNSLHWAIVFFCFNSTTVLLSCFCRLLLFQLPAQEMSRTGSVGFQWGIAGGTTIGLPPVYHHGSEELKNRVMPPCVKGEKVCCLAITEPTAGSDVANLKCTAKLEGDFYILNGEKRLGRSGKCCSS